MEETFGIMANLFHYRGGDLLIHHSVSENPLAVSALPDMHVHEYHEVLYCISGDCSFIVEGREYPLLPGSAMIMRPAEAHRVKINSNAAYERIVINFPDSLIEGIDPQKLLLKPFWSRSQGSLNLHSSPRIRSIMEAQFAPLRNAPRGDETFQPHRDYEIRLSLLIGLLAFLKELNHEFSSLGQAAQGGAAAGRSELLDYVNEHLFDRELSVNMLKDKFYLSVSQLNRSFSRLTGATVREYVMAKRLIQAKLIIEAGRPASEACEASCFKDYSTFYRAYRKRFLVPPVHTRKTSACVRDEPADLEY